MKLSSRARLAGCIAALSCLFVVPAAAGAATNVSAADDNGDYIVTLEGDDGVQNITATQTSNSIVFTGGAITSGTGCTGSGPVTCTVSDWSITYV
ncbi:MAG TPA: hypothetical protein VNT22_10715, partial [Baekduia sp.]|nr:hypothetical protein [Baekduia sp.]